MKKYIALTFVSVSSLMFGQVTIGKTSPSVDVSNASVSLEIGNATGGMKGIVLPYVTSASVVDGANQAPASGTLIFDSEDKKIKFRSAATWVDLSAGASSPAAGVGIADANAELINSKAQIGGDFSTDTTNGVLVLADTDKAMVLPRVSSVADIVNPSPGMMVYVTGTANGTGPNANQLAVFNGSEWSFWTSL